MAKLSHRFEYFAARVLATVAVLLPPRLSDWLGSTLGRLAYRLMASRRRVAIDNLTQALGDELSEERIEEIASDVFVNIGRTLFELPRLERISRQQLIEMVHCDDPESVIGAFNEAKGSILVSSHFGNWEMLGGWIGAMGLSIDFLVGVQHNTLVDNMLVNFRKGMGVGVLRVDTGVRGVFKALKQERIVGTVADQHDPANSIILDFFGRKASQVKGLAAIAAKTGRPVIPMVMRRTGRDRHEIIAGSPIYPVPGVELETETERITIAYTEFFEQCIRRYPDQWLWTHRRWKLK